jgi:hypothetical protein
VRRFSKYPPCASLMQEKLTFYSSLNDSEALLWI